MELRRACQTRERGTDRARAAAQVDDKRRAQSAGGVGRLPGFPQKERSLLHQELGAAPGDEHAGIHGDPQPTEFRPAQDVLQRFSPGPPADKGIQVPRRRGSLSQQDGLFLCEHAAGGTEPGGKGPDKRGIRQGPVRLRHC